MEISTVGIDADWKEAFFVLAVLVNGGEYEEAKKFVSMVVRRPTLFAADGLKTCGICGAVSNNPCPHHAEQA